MPQHRIPDWFELLHESDLDDLEDGSEPRDTDKIAQPNEDDEEFEDEDALAAGAADDEYDRRHDERIIERYYERRRTLESEV